MKLPGVKGVNGFEFARAVSQIKPEIKVLLMTAFDIDDTLLKMNIEYNNNIDGIIQKLVSSAKLARMINEAFKSVMFF